MTMTGESRRLSGRIRLTTAATVEYYERADVKWTAAAKLVDISKSGASIRLNRAVEAGRLILFKSRIPFRYRAYDFKSSEFSTWALIRYVRSDSQEDPETTYRIGLAFIGSEAPESFHADPQTHYALPEKPERNGLWRAVEQSAPRA